MNLRECFEKYRELTISALDKIDNDDIDDIHILIEQRQEVIENMKNIEYTNIEFKSICDEYSILQYDKQLYEVMDKKKMEIKEKMKENVKMQKMKNNYNTTETRAVFLAREV